MKNKFKKSVDKSEETKVLIPREESKISSNDELIKKVEPIVWDLDKTTDLTTEYVTADTYEEDDEIAYIYKEWKVEVLNYEDLEDRITTILPFVHYNIIYKEPSENNVGFSRCHEDLQNTFYFEIREELLYLHVGFSIKKMFSNFVIPDVLTKTEKERLQKLSASLKVPEVKLRIALRNSLKINQ